MAVATQMMRVVARNTDLLQQRLRERGWPLFEPFARMPPGRLATDRNAFTGERRVAAFPDLDGHLRALEKVVGLVPASLEAFWREVGGFIFDDDIDGPRPRWMREVREDHERALNVPSLPELWWTHGAKARTPLVLELDVFPWPGEDAPASIVLPDHALDPVVRNVPGAPRFVPYLRNAFRWGGLPGLAYVERSAELDRVIAELTEGLEPF